MDCPDQTKIFIQDSYYGRLDVAPCNIDGTGGYMPSTPCRTDGYYFTQNECDFKASCTLHADNDIYGDPCHGVTKYLYVSYTCGKFTLFFIGFNVPYSTFHVISGRWLIVADGLKTDLWCCLYDVSHHRNIWYPNRQRILAKDQPIFKPYCLLLNISK